MRRYLRILVLLPLLGSSGCLNFEGPNFRKYQQVQVGMSMAEVEAILGPGTPVGANEVPTVVVAINAQDPIDAEERARRQGLPPPTVRDYPTRHKPVVEGDIIWQWRDGAEVILVAFKAGKVSEKYYRIPSL